MIGRIVLKFGLWLEPLAWRFTKVIGREGGAHMRVRIHFRISRTAGRIALKLGV